VTFIVEIRLEVFIIAEIALVASITEVLVLRTIVLVTDGPNIEVVILSSTLEELIARVVLLEFITGLKSMVLDGCILVVLNTNVALAVALG